MLNPPKRNVVLMVFTENKLFYFSKRALREGTARNKWLKETLNKNNNKNQDRITEAFEKFLLSETILSIP